MSVSKWPEFMIVMQASDAQHPGYPDAVSPGYGRRNECDTPHCAAGWVAAHFNCSVGAALNPRPGTPLHAFVTTLRAEMNGRPNSDIEERFEGWDGGRRMTGAEFARAWNRSIRKHGYNREFNRPRRFR